MCWCVCFSSKFEYLNMWMYTTFTSNKLEFLWGDRNCYILCFNFWSSVEFSSIHVEERRGPCGILVAWWGPVMDVQAEACCFVHLCGGFFVLFFWCNETQHESECGGACLLTSNLSVTSCWTMRSSFVTHMGTTVCRVDFMLCSSADWDWPLEAWWDSLKKPVRELLLFPDIPIWIHPAV